MTDSTLNRFLARGTAAARAAFTPTPPTPASGPDPLYLWRDTDGGQGLYAWDGAAWDALGGTGDLLSTNNLSDVASAATSRTNLGVGTGDSPQFTGVNVGHASDTTITRASAGVIAVEGVNVVTTAGGVTFAADISVPDEAYDATAWNGSVEVPTKNAVRDKIESLGSAGVSRLTSITTTTGTPAATTETDLLDYTLPAGTLASDGQAVRVRCAGTLAATTRSRTVRLYFGSTVIVSTATVSSSNVFWQMEATIVRVDATNQRVNGLLTLGTSSSIAAIIFNSSPTETLSGALSMKMTGQVAGSPVANDIVGNFYIAEFLP